MSLLSKKRIDSLGWASMWPDLSLPTAPDVLSHLRTGRLGCPNVAVTGERFLRA
jgi:hypothetical protein